MPGLVKPIIPESSLIRGLVLDSRDLFSKEAYEERVEKELTKFIKDFREKGTVDANEVRKAVEKFIAVIERALRDLEDAKRKAMQEEYKKLNDIRKLLAEGAKISSKNLKGELEKFGNALKSNALSILRHNRRREARLRRQKAPFGFVLKKLASNRYFDAEVARKAFELGKNALKEPQLFSEIDYLVSMLNKNPDEKTLAKLKERIYRLTKSYESDLDDFLTVEVDIDLEEARKLHRIDHYITFLKMIRRVGNFDGSIRQLESLKKQAADWIYQDTISAKQLERYAVKSFEYGEQLLRTSKYTEDEHFPDIRTRNINLLGVPAVYIINVKKPRPNRAVVLVHQAFGKKETMLTLGKRLASQDYIVVSIDLPQHGQSRDQFRVGRNSEYVLTAVRFLRSNGIKNVGAIGHSLGSMAILFAICGYNLEIENRFYDITMRLDKTIEDIKKTLDKIKSQKYDKDQYDRAVYHATLLSKEYKELKQIILYGLAEMFRTNSRIDAAVLLGSPLDVQSVFHPMGAFALKHFKFVPGMIKEPLFRKLTELGYGIMEKKGGKEIPAKLTEEKGSVQILSAVMPDLYDTFNYVQHVKNPYDYIYAINSLCDDVKNPDKFMGFIRYYRDFIRKTPKLFIIGLKDQWVKPPWKIRKSFDELLEELQEYYEKLGATEMVRMPNVVHALNMEGKDFQFEAGKLPIITYKIVTFLNNYLGRGRLV